MRPGNKKKNWTSLGINAGHLWTFFGYFSVDFGTFLMVNLFEKSEFSSE